MTVAELQLFHDVGSGFPGVLGASSAFVGLDLTVPRIFVLLGTRFLCLSTLTSTRSLNDTQGGHVQEEISYFIATNRCLFIIIRFA